MAEVMYNSDDDEPLVFYDRLMQRRDAREEMLKAEEKFRSVIEENTESERIHDIDNIQPNLQNKEETLSFLLKCDLMGYNNFMGQRSAERFIDILLEILKTHSTDRKIVEVAAECLTDLLRSMFPFKLYAFNKGALELLTSLVEYWKEWPWVMRQIISAINSFANTPKSNRWITEDIYLPIAKQNIEFLFSIPESSWPYPWARSQCLSETVQFVWSIAEREDGLNDRSWVWQYFTSQLPVAGEYYSHFPDYKINIKGGFKFIFGCGKCHKIPMHYKEFKKCGRCGKRSYCCRRCQAQDWENHKEKCVPMNENVNN